jgi:LPXTG-site transpeptidase (sortase) family protein
MPAITSQPDTPAWDVDADWWGPSWDVVTSAGKAGPDRRRKYLPDDFDDDFDEDLFVPSASYVAPPEPSWAQILATTVRLWVSRRRPGATSPAVPSPAGTAAVPADAVSRPAGAAPAPRDSAAPAVGAVGLSAEVPRWPAGRPRMAGWASAVWGAHARVLSAAMLSAGLLAAGAGTAGLVVARTSAPPAVRLAARPSPVAVPTGRTVAPVSFSVVQPAPRPVWLTIPAIGVKAPIVKLGLNRNGTLQVPGPTTVAGWYTGSPRPGAAGSAVIAGHVDSRSGPGIFYWLKNMRRGERIYVRRADGTLAVFTVTAVQIYTKNHFPTAMVYGPVPDAELRLITCGGTFDYARGSYLSNVVVYARLSA